MRDRPFPASLLACSGKKKENTCLRGDHEGARDSRLLPNQQNYQSTPVGSSTFFGTKAMPKVRRSRKRPPEGWELIEPTLDELDQKMREGK